MLAKIVTVTCSSMHCYEQAEDTDDPLRPPFCKKCKTNKKG